MVNVGVIGYGYWGPNLVRNFLGSGVSSVSMVSDLDEQRLGLVKQRYPAIETTLDHVELINSTKVDAVVIATPVHTHFDLALSALKAGKHVFVEKPLASTSEQCRILIEEAKQRGLVLMVDHTFIYTGAVQKLKSLVSSGEIGRTCYYDSVRVNLGLFQSDVSVIWDLAVHDMAILDYVFGYKPVAVSATGISNFSGKPENVAYLSIFFDEPVMAHIHVNWLSPVKLRRTLIGGDKKMVVYDDLEVSEKIKVYDKGLELAEETVEKEKIYQTLVGYRSGDMYAPKLSEVEALQTEVAHFVEAIDQNIEPISSGASGLQVVKLLEAATESIASRGAPVMVDGESS